MRLAETVNLNWNNCEIWTYLNYNSTLKSIHQISLAFDENGRFYIILREQEKKKRVKGLKAYKVGTFFV